MSQAQQGDAIQGTELSSKPRARMSAYAYFLESCHKEHKEKHPDGQINFEEFSRNCAEQWDTIDNEKRKRFEELAEKDKTRYKLEMQNYAEYSKRPKIIKDPNVPKRPLSAFFWFSLDEREKIMALNPEFEAGDIARELGKMWLQIRPEVRQKYELVAEKDEQRYKKEIIEYKAQQTEVAKEDNSK